MTARGSYDVIVPQDQDAAGAAQDQFHRRARDAERRRLACAPDLRASDAGSRVQGCRILARDRESRSACITSVRRRWTASWAVSRISPGNIAIARSRGKQHGFTNANDTLKELHSGISKAYPCGAGLGLLGVGTAGDVSLCHRFVDSPVGKMGNVQNGGVDHDARNEFLETHHLSARHGLPHLLGAAGVRRRLLSRSIHPLRRYVRGQSALLRLDPRLERPVFADLRRDQRSKSVVFGTLRRTVISQQ